MALTASKVRVAVTGAISKGALGATAPSGTSGTLTGFTDLGYVGEDGIEIELPDAGDSNAIKAWQGGATVRVVRTPSEDLPTWKFTLLETGISTIETYFGVTVTAGASEGSFTYSATTQRPYNAYVVDVVDGAELIRDYIPRGIVTDVESHTYANGDAIAYGVTISAELDSTLGGNFKRFSTSLKTGN